jgi:iron complex outermembrane receptor protein
LGRGNRVSAGIDAEGQMDERLQRGIDGSTGDVTDVSIDERQTVTGVGVFLNDELEIFENFEITGSVRYDWVRFQVLDRHFVNSPDDSGELDFSEWSYAGAILWKGFRPATPYFRVATSFETPTTTGFANPNGGGLNPDLDAQTALSFELGLKGIIGDRLLYELSVFHIRVDDELLPYQQNFSTFYENAEESERFGVELGFLLPLPRDFELSFTYTYSDFRFVEFESQDGNRYDGNQIPGVPEHLVSLGLAYRHPLGFFADWDFHYVGERFANNANDAGADDYTLSNLRLGYGGFIGGWELSGFVGLNNMSNASYIDNLRINDQNGRYYEPAPDFNAYGGVSISYHFAGLAAGR